ncbi:hypothetical protein Z043_102358 [Scleropages formosus]|uniref:Uncharacterized protein n=1 Tax=Scleropages formosus TaxID=113540 RepID=A0A0N8K2M6_SCLFO|nr:hypothetical protein Z043_102358 [Scleropages formosus]
MPERQSLRTPLDGPLAYYAILLEAMRGSPSYAFCPVTVLEWLGIYRYRILLTYFCLSDRTFFCSVKLNAVLWKHKSYRIFLFTSFVILLAMEVKSNLPPSAFCINPEKTLEILK